MPVAADREETFGLVGESGCGKSTLLRVLCGLNRNWQGEITIAGEAITPNRSRAFFKNVQMVFQDPYGSLHPRTA
jgi:peptide/nickel transport system ATP-binding protein